LFEMFNDFGATIEEGIGVDTLLKSSVKKELK